MLYGMEAHNQSNTTLQIDMDETRAELTAQEHHHQSGYELEQLVKQFETIIAEKAIFYPAAYRFSRELGRGRQGIVFLGIRHGARGCTTRHAIKIFDPSLYSSPGRYWTDMGRIAHQVSKLQTMNSPQLIFRDIYDECNGIGYTQMEVVDGLDLNDMLKPETLKRAKRNSTARQWARITDTVFRIEEDRASVQPGVALYILRETLRGLESLHAQGFLHSDIKPSNLMISRSGYMKLIDFGRATRIKEQSTILFGTPAYMSPEAHRREPCGIQSDLFGVGLLGLTLLLGELPDWIQNANEKDMIQGKMQLAERLEEILPHYVLKNAEFVDLLRRFLHPDPSHRFSNAEEAESGQSGLQLVHKQLTLTGQDSEYDRELKLFMNRVLPPGDSVSV